MHNTPTQLLALTMLALFAMPSFADDQPSWRAHYLANAGVMVSRGDTKILFDPFFRSDYGIYDRVPVATEAALFKGEPPWDGIDAVFISHHHGDHFDPAVVMSFLRAWPTVELFGPQQAITALLALQEQPDTTLSSRLHGIALERDSAAAQLTMKGLQIEAVRVAHSGWPERHAHVENIVFRVTLDNVTTVMHLGDADSDSQHYEPHSSFWQGRTTNLALPPVWLFLTDMGRAILHKYIGADHSIGIHVDTSVADEKEHRPPELEGLDLFTRPGETRSK
ncbi:MAG: MBL fold metallo-hydrolase [Gammaproteobacteria bacterium]|nr:MBL fold metallo-hydrolase [Gammaproteobacteria bacterium]